MMLSSFGSSSLLIGIFCIDSFNFYLIDEFIKHEE